jgi:superfamily II DNA or RNA helicase
VTAPHPIQRRYLAEQIVRLRRADEEERYASSQRQGRIDPNPHQIDAVIFALKRLPEGGCILADEVGLGKTIEAGLVLAQLRAEGAASRILLIVPKPLLGQWQDELYRLFSIQAIEGRMEVGAFSEDGVFIVGREAAGSERGAAILREADPFDLCVIDEAHEIFANIYRRYDKDGIYREDSDEARMADRVRSFLRQSPVLLLTATPIQNNLTELWGLVQYVEPTGTLLGNLRTFRDVFCEGDDRQLVRGQDEEIRRRIGTVVKRTLRRQAQDFLERPFVARRAQLFHYSMAPREKALYDDVTAYLLEPQLLAFRGNQRQLLLIGFHRLMASSVAALAESLRKVAERLERLASGERPDYKAFLEDLDDEDIRFALEDDGGGEDDRGTPDPDAVARELQRVRDFIQRAETLSRDSKADKLLEVMRIIADRPAERRRVVIFTESLITQDYLQKVLIAKGGFAPEAITIFRGVNNSARANQALERWQSEVGEHLPTYQRPSRAVAVRLALVHEFKTRSQIFISTEAGAKGLNLQFCDTIINYDLPWNPQRIEQRIGRCHRYGQQHDVTVINFLSSDNEAQQLTFEILSDKLDLFGRVLDASDVVLHEPSTDAPEKIAGMLGSDFETRLRRIYERARTLDEITAELRRLREQMDEERKKYEDTWARTAGLIESRFDESVKRFLRIQAELPKGLAKLDHDLEQLVTGYLYAHGVPFQRVSDDGHVRLQLQPSLRLPEGFEGGVTILIGRAMDLADADPLHPSHPLVHAAVEEARAATEHRFRVSWAVTPEAPSALAESKTKGGRLVLSRVRYTGFERVDRLVLTVLFEGESSPLDPACGRWLLDQPPRDRADNGPPLVLDAELDDAIEEMVFVDQAEVSKQEQQRFDRNLEQIERYVEDQLLVLRRRLAGETKSLRSAEERRDAALGSDARDDAEKRIRAIQKRIDELESEIERLEKRDDPDYGQWRDRAHERRYRPPEVTRILDVEFVLE